VPDDGRKAKREREGDYFVMPPFHRLPR
jgi:hypothetical protein